MALQWVILAYVVAAEAAVALLLTLPSPKLLRNRLVSVISLVLQPALFIVPFAGFQLLGCAISCSWSLWCRNYFDLLLLLFVSWWDPRFVGLVSWSDIYWKNEHRMKCTSEICTAAERDRYEKAVSFIWRFPLLSVDACFCAWCPSEILLVARFAFTWEHRSNIDSNLLRVGECYGCWKYVIETWLAKK